MKHTELFTKTRKENPADEVSRNAELLIRAGFVHKEMAGVYSFLPLGLRVLRNIERIIREEIEKIGGQEVLLTALQNPELWQATNRWSDDVVDNWFKTSLKNGTELGLGFTHEEAITAIMKQHIASYRDLPVYAYQIQTKFRNEERAKSGIMRGREFLMKDLYSFNATQEDLDTFYERCAEAYTTIFSRVGIGAHTFKTFASGGVFSKYSHEFQTVSDAGEDTIYLSREKNIAVNEEVYTDEILNDLNLKKSKLEKVTSIEVGNIFKLGTRFSEALGLTYKDKDGSVKPVIMGSYGIGPSRLMGTIVEVLSDEKGIVWPESVAPFQVHLLSLGADTEANAWYEKLQSAGIETLFDDRDGSAGEKFGDSDLLGIPYRLVVSKRSLEKGGAEVKGRTENESKILSFGEVEKKIIGKEIGKSRN
jgi:prolyl-tRNA synthetase